MQHAYSLSCFSGLLMAVCLSLSACTDGSDPGPAFEGGAEEPLVGSAGAPERMPGCLNSNLYRGGPHFVETITRVTNADMTGYTLTADSTYTVLEERADGSSVVSVEDSVTSDSGLAFTSTNVYELDGYVLTLIGPVRETGLAPDPDPQEWFFGLAPVEESGVSTAEVDRGARSEDGSILYTDVSNVQTYIGNEVVETPIGSFEACRVTYVASDGLSESTVWYAVGSGIKVKTQNFFYNVGPDRITTESGTQLESASINDVMISP